MTQNPDTLNQTAGIRAFTENIIDYAGLFPPAKLNLDEAFRNYVQYSNSEFQWMLSRFICPVKVLADLKTIIKNNYSTINDLNLSVIGRGGHNEADFNKNLSEDLNYLESFNSDFEKSVKTNVLEIKLPDELITSHDDKKISDFIYHIFSNIENRINHPIFIYFEGHVGTDWKKNISALIEGIKLHNEKNINSGFKFRTGGVEAYSFPTPEQIAFCIRECVDREIPMKCTAGLHHPFRHYNKEIDSMMHGFINVFGAGIIALRHNISNPGLKNILSDEDPRNFIFTNDYFSWKDWKISIEDIEFARKDLMISFGSCSFEDPVNDLKSLKLL